MAAHYVGAQDTRNEPREWLKKLEWDCTPRLRTWLSEVYGVEDDEYHRAVARCWLVSIVARIMKPGCKVDTMPVLIGPQGTGKSTSLEVLGGKWYATINVSADKMQDFLMSLGGVLVAEIAELDAIKGTANSRVKTILSTSTDKFRPPYGRVVKEFERTAIMVGTTNEMGWHRDETGGRRYWPIECTKAINVDWLRSNRDQLFAEAKVLYDAGIDWWDVPVDEQNRRVMEHHTTDPWEDRIAAWIAGSEVWTGYGCDVIKVFADPMENEASKRWGTIISTSRVLTECIQMPVERQNKPAANKVGQVMRNMGFELIKIRASKTRTVWAWCVPQVTEAPNGQRLLPLNEIEAK
jgi:predicted P-loop ATPase